jgi:predicted  nucleic acid-binding Zn-ribbon protein
MIEIKDDKHVLCIKCRATFTEAGYQNASGCPSCGDKGVPATLQRQTTLDITHHELRVLCIWASNYADGIKDPKMRDPMKAALRGIFSGLRSQDPNLPALSLFDEIQEVADTFNTKAKLLSSDGEVATTFEPSTRH